MSQTTESSRQNQILAALPELEYSRIAPYLEAVFFPSGLILQEPGEMLNRSLFSSESNDFSSFNHV